MVNLDSISVPDYNFVLANSVDPGEIPSGSTLFVNVCDHLCISHQKFFHFSMPTLQKCQIDNSLVLGRHLVPKWVSVKITTDHATKGCGNMVFIRI